MRMWLLSVCVNPVGEVEKCGNDFTASPPENTAYTYSETLAVPVYTQRATKQEVSDTSKAGCEHGALL